MLPLYEDQIYSNKWAELADYIYSNLPNGNDPWENEFLAKNLHVKKIGKYTDIPHRGVVFINGHNSLIDLFRCLKPNGSYIVIARDRDYSLNNEHVRYIPRSVKKFYTINTPFKNSVIEPIPVGTATRNGYSGTLSMVCQKNIARVEKPLIYCRVTLTNTEAGRERHNLINKNINNNIFCIDRNFINAEEMFEKIASHKFNACPAGEGKDCIRTYETICLGSIPIWSDCAETRHFSSLPVIYTNDWCIDENWCESKLLELHARKTSTDIMRMSYWIDHFNSTKNALL